MKTKMIAGMIMMLLVVSIMLSVGSVMAAPKKAKDKNDNLTSLPAGSDEWLIMENGAGTKRAWCIYGPNAGKSIVLLDTSKLGAKAVAQLVASGDWTYSNTFTGYIYKWVQD
jgi:hypothetical protein